MTQNKNSSEKIEDHPIAKIINNFLHDIRDIDSGAKHFVPLSIALLAFRFEAAIDDFKNGAEKINSDNSAQKAAGIKKTHDAIDLLERIDKSKLPKALEKSLFLGLFSAFDSYTGKLLFEIFVKKPDTLNGIKGNISFKEAMRFDDSKSLRESIICETIENFRRESYIDQFNKLENWFDFRTLREYDNWPKFIECTQRRNLMTHCDGKVTKQYLNICRQNKYEFSEDIKEGSILQLRPDYFLNSCELIMETGVKLGQTLWRKLFPQEIHKADEHLSNISYDFLKLSKWHLVELFCMFFHEQTHEAQDINKKIITVNHSIALKRMDKTDALRDILDKLDCSGAALDFRLALDVLKDDYSGAAETMHRLGKESTIVKEESYHLWPLFDDFRSREEFLNAYEKIYGYPFIQEQTKKAKIKEASLKEKLQVEDKEIEKQKDSKGLINKLLSLLPKL